MSLINNIPTNAIPIQTETSFAGDYIPADNIYQFDALLNKNVGVLGLKKNSIYFIDTVNFSLDIDEQIFKEAIDSSSIIKLILKTKKTKVSIYQFPLPFINYVDNLEFQFYFQTGQKDDELTADLVGQLLQPAGLVGDLSIKALIQLNIYQVTDIGWINWFNNPRNRQQGEELVLRGRA